MTESRSTKKPDWFGFHFIGIPALNSEVAECPKLYCLQLLQVGQNKVLLPGKYDSSGWTSSNAC